jgi:hypothetical protein
METTGALPRAGTLFPSRIGLTSFSGLDFPLVPVSSQGRLIVAAMLLTGIAG